MDVEVSIARNFVLSHLYNKLPRRRVDCFGEELEKGFKIKFQGHWYPDMPYKGSAFRCVKVSGIAADPLVEHAAIASGISIEEVRENLPQELTLWVDPKEVSYRIGEKGLVKVLYSQKKDEFPCEVTDGEVSSVSGFHMDSQLGFRPIENLSASMSSLNLSPPDDSSPTSPWATPSPTHAPHLTSSGNSPINNNNNPFIPTLQRSLSNQHQQHHQFTAAMFAQTKFGSTKLKTNAKRPNRLSPTDFGGYMKQRAVMQSHWINGVGAVSPMGVAGYNALNGFPGPSLNFPAAPIPAPVPRGRQSLSPREIHHDYLSQQQQYLILQQAQQAQQLQAQQQAQHLQMNHSHTLTTSLPSPTIYHKDQPANDSFPPTTTPTRHSTDFQPFNHTNAQPPAFSDDVINEGDQSQSPSSDLGLQGIVGRLQNSALEEEDFAGQLVSGSNSDSRAWGNMSSPYASLQHLLVAN